MGESPNTQGKIAVYTAITGNFDTLKEKQNKTNADYFAYLSTPHKSSTWNVRPIEYRGKTHNLTAKYYKLHPHKLFPEYKYSLWVDGSIEVIANVAELVKRYLNKNNWAVHRHASRKNIIEESIACVRLGKANEVKISKQVARYIVREKYKSNKLAENTVILRRHNDPKVIKVNEEWWDECNKWTSRDQISFNYVAWKNNLDYTEMDGTIYSTKDFKLYGHQIK